MVRFTQAWSRLASLSLRTKLLAMFTVWLVFTGVFGVMCASMAMAPLEQDEQRTSAALMCSEAKRAFVNLDTDLVTEIAEAKQRRQDDEQLRLAQAAQPSGPPPVQIQAPVPNWAPVLPEALNEPTLPTTLSVPKFTYHHGDPGFERPGLQGATTDSGMIRSYLDLAHQAQEACGPWLPDTHTTQWRDVMLANVTDDTVAAFRADVMRLLVS